MTATQKYWLILVLASLIFIASTIALILMLAKIQVGFCFEKSGEVIVIMRGGRPVRMIMPPDAGTYINPPPGQMNHNPAARVWEVIPIGPGYVNTRGWLAQLLGVHFFVPFIEQVYGYNFSWSEYVQPEGTALTYEERSRVERVRTIFIKQFQYAEVALTLPTEDGVYVDVRYAIAVTVNNPHTALFKTADWLQRVNKLVEPALRDWVGEQTFKQLQSESDKKGLEPLYASRIKPMNDQIPSESPGVGTKDLFGVTIIDVAIVKVVDSADPMGRNLATRTLAWEAGEKAKATRAAGEAEADVILAKGKAAAEAEKLLLAAQTAPGGAFEIALRKATFPTASTVVLSDDAARVLLQPHGNGRP